MVTTLDARVLSREPARIPDPTRVAVLLNRNARKVTDRLAQRMERIVGSENMYYSRSLDEARSLTREIVQRGYGTVVCGGGDGTLARAVNLIQSYISESNAWRRERRMRYGDVQAPLLMPRFAFLKLGTGNGIRRVVGAGAPLDDLRRIVDYAPGRTFRMPVIEHQGERFFFGGMGYDSMLLNDYNSLRVRTQNPLLRPIMHTVGGYFAALFSRTLPRILNGGDSTRLQARVTTRGRAFYIDPRRGDAAVEMEAGSILFEGDARMIAAATSPFYGFGLRMFPFATLMPNMMHLRIATLGPFATLAHLPSIWQGTYRNARHVADFLVNDIRVELANPFPFQHSGDAQGMRRELSLRVADEPVQLVDYLGTQGLD